MVWRVYAMVRTVCSDEMTRSCGVLQYAQHTSDQPLMKMVF